MPTPKIAAPLTRATDLFETGHVLRKAQFRWGYDLATTAVDGVDAEIADGLFYRLSESNVKFAALGRPQARSTDETGEHADAALLCPATVPERHTL